jgi:hypothetical protein
LIDQPCELVADQAVAGDVLAVRAWLRERCETPAKVRADMVTSDELSEVVGLVDKVCESMNYGQRADFLALLAEEIGERADAAYEDLPIADDREEDPQPDDGTIAQRSASLFPRFVE